VNAIMTVDPADGRARATQLRETTDTEVAAVVAAARAGGAWLREAGRDGRARTLDQIGASLEARRAELVAVAVAETGLPTARLDLELTRAATQFRMFADVVRDGGYLEAAIDHAGETVLGPAPDVRRMLVPLGPVAVFGASNFPFAFSVAGGDTASALAAGCPVVVKAHPSHPLTSDASYRAIADAIEATGGPAGVIGIVFGQSAGLTLVRDPAVRAATLTGSLHAGRAIQTAINARPEPIPFYAELSSINPVVVLPGAAAARGRQIAEGLFASFTGSGGQLCTKPGLVFVPTGEAGDAVVRHLRALVAAAPGATLLNERIRDGFHTGQELLQRAGARVLATAPAPSSAGFVVAPAVLELELPDLSASVAQECFGPLTIVVRYDDAAGLDQWLPTIPGSLTGSIHADESDDRATVLGIADRLAAQCGRLVFNGYPTGVRVSWAQHHGGPWPSTNSVHTSVGATAIRRFLRPIAWQDAPDWALPPELRNGFDGIPRRVDGQLEVAGHAVAPTA
jgi:NADP-dependent aldehyde dehydrogenase